MISKCKPVRDGVELNGMECYKAVLSSWLSVIVE